MSRKRTQLIIFLIAAVCVITVQAHADTFSLVLNPANCGSGASCNGYDFTTLVTSPTVADPKFEVSFTVHNESGQVAYLQGFGLTLFGGTAIDATFINSTPPLGWNIAVVDNAKYDNGNPTKDNCKASKGKAGSFCVDITNKTGGYLLKQGDTITFDLSVTGVGGQPTILPIWHIMTNGTKGAVGGGNVFALSNDGPGTLQPPPPPPTIPEPASLVLFGSGTLALVRTVRRRR